MLSKMIYNILRMAEIKTIMAREDLNTRTEAFYEVMEV